jgi:SAM-dependent methyltransferase
MKRIPEPELMDDLEQARAYADADFSEPHQAFVRYFQERFPEFERGEALDLGCGPADVTMRFALAYPAASVTGVDGVEAMLALGRDLLARQDLKGRVTLVQSCLPAPMPRRYDAVISNSLLHHLADPAVLWDTIKQAAKPGAPVFVMDLLRPHSIEEAERLTATYAGAAPAVLRKDFFNSLLAAYQPDELRAQLYATGFGHLHIEQVSDRHVVIWGRFE